MEIKARKLLLRILAIIVIGLTIGSNILLIIVPIGFYYMVMILSDLVRLIINKLRAREVISERLINAVITVGGLVLIAKLQLLYARNNFSQDIASLKSHYSKTGKYPASLDEIQINKNPYISLLGPKYQYRSLGSDVEAKPNFCLVEISPFGRRCYRFDKNEEVYID